MKQRILVVDDEPDIVDLLTYNLAREGYDVVSASNGREALDRAPGSDLVILDLMMPLLDGFETCTRLKRNPATAAIPVIILTARQGEAYEIKGLETGADDFIQKPISPRKLIARVRALLRRGERSEGETGSRPVIRVGRLEINRENYTVTVGQSDVFFPRKEFELLFLLASHPGRVYSREVLLENLWGHDVQVLDRTIDVHIRRIREKLGDLGAMIETIKGVGYRLSPEHAGP